MIVTRFAPVKVNLYLDVGPPRADGRHPLDSLVMFAADVGDWVSVGPASDLTLALSGPFASLLMDQPDNIVLKAARLLADTAGIEPHAALELSKCVPVEAGLGGGSADAAATLLALNDYWGLKAPVSDLAPLAAQLGADVPACLAARPVHMTGTGESISLAEAPGLDVVLVYPALGVSTAAVYRQFDAMGLGGGFTSSPATSSGPSFRRDVAARGNALEAPAVALNPAIGEALDLLRAMAPERLVRMSGSGACCFVVVSGADEAALLAEKVRAARPGWWIVATQLVGADSADRA